MIVRLLKPEERFDAAKISTVAFHGRIDDIEKARENSLKETIEDWGAFSDDGKIMARIINNAYTVHLDGTQVSCGGIGAVSTLPEYREEGAIRAIFQKLLPEARRRGEVISALYPFNHAFYRKFGYETVCKENTYSFAPDVIRGYHFYGSVEMFMPGSDVRPYAELYEAFASRYNLSMVRSDEMMLKHHLNGTWYQDRKFTYLLRENDGPVAYLTFQDVRNEPAAILRVRDLAWSGRTGFLAILGFLARFSADYGTIELVLPSDLELLSVIRSSNAYGISKSTAQGYMVRAVHVPKLLESISVPEDESFVIRVQDELIEENNGTWQVRKHHAEKTDQEPELVVSERALGQMAVGAVSLREAELRNDVEICGDHEKLQRIFVRKPLWVADHF